MFFSRLLFVRLYHQIAMLGSCRFRVWLGPDDPNTGVSGFGAHHANL